MMYMHNTWLLNMQMVLYIHEFYAIISLDVKQGTESNTHPRLSYLNILMCTLMIGGESYGAKGSMAQVQISILL